MVVKQHMTKELFDSMSSNLKNILKHFDVSLNPSSYGNGHINDTYLIKTDPGYILQKINTNVFHNPVDVMENIKKVTEHLRVKIAAAGGNPDRETLTVINTVEGAPYYKDENGDYYRMYIFIDGARSYDTVEDPMQLYNAAKAFGTFQNMLADFPAAELHEVIPNFHNTVSRYNDFKKAVEENLSGRADSCMKEIEFVLAREADASVVISDMNSGKIPLRVTHNDTKLNNVMMDEKTGKAICVIDLDTIMPGSALYDFGDSIRFGASSALEDEKDLSKVYVRLDMFEEYLKGFIEGLGKGALTNNELRALPIGAYMMTIETGMRFLGDYLNGDVYFAVHRDGHNLDRARTQLKLVSDMESKMDQLNAIVEKYI